MPAFTELELGGWDPLDPAISADPYPSLAALRKQNWLARGVFQGEVFGVCVLSYQAVMDILVHPELRVFEHDLPEIRNAVDERTRDMILFMDGAPHHRIRRLLGRALGARFGPEVERLMVKELETLLESVAGEPSFEAVKRICAPFTMASLCAFLGIPREDWHLFERWSPSVSKLITPEAKDAIGELERTFKEMDEYIGGLYAERRARPTGDLLSRLVEVNIDGDRLTDRELKATLPSMLIAGTDTTRNQLALTMRAFAQHPDQWERLRADPSLLETTVEELFRFAPSNVSTPRLAVRPFEYQGIRFDAGTSFVCLTASANRDERVFPDPDRFDISRKTGAAKQVTFGGGMYSCIGAALGRASVRIALSVLARRVKAFSLPAAGTFSTPTGLYGPSALPVSLTLS